MLDDNKIVECCDELLVRGIMSHTEGLVREIAQERAVRACAIHAVNRGLGLKEAAANFAAQLRNARAERYRKGREERRGDLWECGAGGIEQALWVQKQEQHRSDCFQENFSRAKEAPNALTNLASEAPNAAEFVTQAQWELQQDSHPPKANESEGHTGRRTEQRAALYRSDNDKCGGALSNNGEPQVLRKPKERAPEPSLQPTGTKEFWESFVAALDAAEAELQSACEQPKTRGKRTRCRKRRATQTTSSSEALDA